ncbi:hypothetical protein [Zavarzinia sp.]|uniref:hypothetical protein n=1 Tax=Zavarzinia sp. TaxID=2027920 RepID=UPI003567B270
MRIQFWLQGGLALFAVSVSAAPALAEDLTFKLLNSTSVAVTEFYLSPTNVNDWEENLLGDDTLSAGTSTSVTVADGRKTCTYDIKSVFKDGDVVEDRGVNLCELGSYTLHQ